MKAEVWKQTDLGYLVSNRGRVRSPSGRILKPRKHSAGYHRVSLGKENDQYIHRLVAMAFIPNPDNLPMVNHLNGIKADNRPENLEWVTCKSNHIHAYSIGLYDKAIALRKLRVGTLNAAARLEDKDVIYIRQHWGLPNYSVTYFVERFKVSRATVYRIINRQSWTHI